MEDGGDGSKFPGILDKEMVSPLYFRNKDNDLLFQDCNFVRGSIYLVLLVNPGKSGSPSD